MQWLQPTLDYNNMYYLILDVKITWISVLWNDMDACCIHYESVRDVKLASLTTFKSQKTLLDAAKKRKHQKPLEVASKLEESEVPKLSYHKTCRLMFTLKRDLEKLQSDAVLDRSSPEKKIRREQRSSDGSQGRLVLQKKCIFCNKVSKYSKENRTREKLTLCQTISVDDKVRRSALENHDIQHISLSTKELIAKEAYYHSSCYSTYTIILYYHDMKYNKYTINLRHCICCN